MRPWEWDICPADIWTEAIEIRNAYDLGVEDAHAELKGIKRTEEWMKQEKVGRVG